jgi:hypothetical protein
MIVAKLSVGQAIGTPNLEALKQAAMMGPIHDASRRRKFRCFVRWNDEELLFDCEPLHAILPYLSSPQG